MNNTIASLAAISFACGVWIILLHSFKYGYLPDVDLSVYNMFLFAMAIFLFIVISLPGIIFRLAVVKNISASDSFIVVAFLLSIFPTAVFIVAVFIAYNLKIDLTITMYIMLGVFCILSILIARFIVKRSKSKDKVSLFLGLMIGNLSLLVYVVAFMMPLSSTNYNDAITCMEFLFCINLFFAIIRSPSGAIVAVLAVVLISLFLIHSNSTMSNMLTSPIRMLGLGDANISFTTTESICNTINITAGDKQICYINGETGRVDSVMMVSRMGKELLILVENDKNVSTIMSIDKNNISSISKTR
jgi:hypothetical protein